MIGELRWVTQEFYGIPAGTPLIVIDEYAEMYKLNDIRVVAAILTARNGQMVSYVWRHHLDEWTNP